MPAAGGSVTAARPAPPSSERAAPETRNERREIGSSETTSSEPALTGNAILHVQTTPEGAEVFLNDRSIGTTPFQAENLPAGEHRLRLAHRYFESWEQIVRLEDDVVERITAELQRGVGRVTVITEPPGAEVWIDGTAQPQRTPLTISDLVAGEQALEIRLDRFRTITYRVEILPEETARLDLQLEGGDLHEWEGRWLTGEEVIPLLLEAAEADLAATRLMAPEGDNAWEKYRRVLDLQPGNEAAQAGIEQIAARYVELAEAALAEGELERAEAFLGNAATAGAAGAGYRQAWARLEALEAERLAALQAERQRIERIRAVQVELARLGAAVAPSGELDAATIQAIRAFERVSERPQRGEATEALLASLRSAERWPGPQPGDVFRECPDCPEMVMIPAGRFTMGNRSSVQRRTVNVPSFALGTKEVTFAQWDACAADGGCSHRPDDYFKGRGSRPVINVNWNDAQDYVRWLSGKTGEDYRLPSESEWEYAARAGTTTSFHTGNCITTDQANFDGNYPLQSCPRGEYRRRTVPVGSFAPNAFGLHDMHGNVWEWVQDCRNGSYNGAPSDGSAWMSGDCGRAVLRGGSWNESGPNVTSTSLSNRSRGTRNGIIGFRVARSVYR